MEYAETFLRLSRQPDAIDEVQEVSDQVLRLTGEDLSRPIGTMGSGYLRYRTRLNVSAAMGLGVHDPAEITAFDWDAFWSWARQRGISDPETLEYLLPGQDVEQVPWVVRAILEGQSPEQYRWAEGRATYRIIQGLGYERTADLEADLGQPIEGMSVADLKAAIQRRWALLRDGIQPSDNANYFRPE